MEVIIPGHRYRLDNLKDSGSQILSFRNDGVETPGVTHSGTYNQEALRVLIDRVQVLDKQLKWEGNKEITYHLRVAIALHEARAIIRKAEKATMVIETYPCGTDGHLIINTYKE